MYSIYGKEVAENIIKVNYEFEDMKVTGCVGKPQIAKSNRSSQLFFVNKRYIKDKMLTAATEQAYKGLIPIGKFGFVILNIEMNPAKVDVNVHPAKLEVRFQEESKVFQAIYHTIKDTLLKSELVANTEKPSNQIERTAESFEERLKNIRENAKQNEGLFSFRKQREKQIEQYTNEESKIKTNVAEAKPEIKQENMSVEPKTEKIGNPLDTSDILLQLKQMKEKMEEEIKNTSTLKEEKEDVDAQHDRHILVARNGRDAVDEERVRHGIRAGRQHDEGVEVTDGRADEAVAARLDLLDHALCAGAGKADPVPDERRHPLLAEAAAGAALRERAVPAVYIIKSAERLDDASTLHAQSPDSEDSVVGSGSVGAVVGASVGASVGSGPSETSSVTIVSLATLEFAASL